MHAFSFTLKSWLMNNLHHFSQEDLRNYTVLKTKSIRWKERTSQLLERGLNLYYSMGYPARGVWKILLIRWIHHLIPHGSTCFGRYFTIVYSTTSFNRQISTWNILACYIFSSEAYSWLLFNGKKIIIAWRFYLKL